MSRERIHHVLQLGIDKGFNLTYVRKVLLKKGYDEEEVDACIEEFKTGKPKKQADVHEYDIEPEEEPQDEPETYVSEDAISSKNRYIKYLYAIILILIISLGISLLLKPEVIEHEIIIEKDCSDVQPIQCEPDDTPLKEKLERYNELSQVIDQKQAKIDAQLAQIAHLNATIEDKQASVDMQVEELRKLNSYVKEERKEIVKLLIEVINFILKR